jgi:hypothetical protein
MGGRERRGRRDREIGRPAVERRVDVDAEVGLEDLTGADALAARRDGRAVARRAGRAQAGVAQATARGAGAAARRAAAPPARGQAASRSRGGQRFPPPAPLAVADQTWS